jgi:putative ABC transport system permease protein
MFENHLRIALRNLRRHKGYAFVNIAGLAVGMACCLLILLFVRDERSYDRFHAEADRIYRLVREGGGQAPTAQQGSSIGLRVADALPEVEKARFVDQA